ncbi:hypothetical protein DV515_00010211 [Chloebia gouldiae]|uniref:Ig-like domain-containing protein n=1 Tax=Chloebia gouldiae TaxID=44316 RepID=A0A3L8SAX7_CHLGU|nr:hypothetical protein DV515_00010211 [Chloebia gouldiae]
MIYEDPYDQSLLSLAASKQSFFIWYDSLEFGISRVTVASVGIEQATDAGTHQWWEESMVTALQVEGMGMGCEGGGLCTNAVLSFFPNSMTIVIVILAAVIILIIGFGVSGMEALISVTALTSPGNTGQCSILGCSFEPDIWLDSIAIQWAKEGVAGLVHEFKAGKDHLQEQGLSFQGRTAVFADQVIGGNASLELKDVQLSDAGTYQCSVTTDRGPETHFKEHSRLRRGPTRDTNSTSPQRKFRSCRGAAGEGYKGSAKVSKREQRDNFSLTEQQGTVKRYSPSTCRNGNHRRDFPMNSSSAWWGKGSERERTWNKTQIQTTQTFQYGHLSTSCVFSMTMSTQKPFIN